MSRPWKPSPALKASFALHAVAGAGLLAAPEAWPLALGAVVVNHGFLTAAGLLPRTAILGPNLTRLPEPARARREVSLTIDDGPDPEVTPRVLDMLDAAGARASFFCVGAEARRHPALVREIAARGHGVENHSMRHLKRFAALGPRAMAEEVSAAQACLGDIAGRLPAFFRPTAGLRSPFLEPILCRLDLQLASWTRRAYDTRQGDPDRVHRILTTNLASGDILLLHDGNGAPTASGQPVILATLPRLLATLEAAGLRSVPLHSAVDPAGP
ncbi:MAG TPA: polysaccharide deacetylase family protein [Rhodocyclaceae bacterium]|nr:polysaccharide deacetylase family protein [Rhodocyclaceae bacterium]